MTSAPADAEIVPLPATRRLRAIHVSGRRGQPDLELPVIDHHHGTGPTAAIVANVHGDEATGVGAIHALDAWLTAHGLAGRVVLYPSVNPQGLSRQTRQVPPDDVDLNRVFPGTPRGTWASRIAAALWVDLQQVKPDVVVDLHSDAPDAIPYVIVDRPVRLGAARRQALAEQLLPLADATGLTVLREYPDDVYVHFGLDRSLAGCVVNQLGVPAFTLEVGPRRALRGGDVTVMADAVRGVLGTLGLIRASSTLHASRADGPWRRAAPPRPRRGGLLVPVAAPGERFAAGTPLAEIRDLSGSVLEEVLAEADGVVVSWVETPWVAAGALLGTLAVRDGKGL